MQNFQRNRNNGGDEETMSQFGSLVLFADQASGDESDGNNEESADSNAESTTNTLPPAPTVLSSQFATRAGEVFDRVNTNGDDFLSTAELSAALQNPAFARQDAQVVAALYQSRSNLQSMSNDEWGWENDGVTRADLQIFEQTNSARMQATNAASIAEGQFDTYDTDHDGFIARTELDAALQNPNLVDFTRQHLEHLRNNYDAIQGAINDEWGFENNGMSRADLVGYGDYWENSAIGQAESAVSSSVTRTQEGQTNHLNSNLYATSDDPLLSITPDAIVQGTIGDCYLLASISALAASNPQAIRDMIRDNNNGTYTVTFPGDPANPVTVTAPTDAERGLYNGGHKYGTWAGVIERAFGQYRAEHGGYTGNTPTENADGGGWTSDTIRLLTGRNTESITPSDLSNSDLAARLDQALNSGTPRAVTAEIDHSFFASQTADGYPMQHAYSIIDFEPDGNGGGMVTVRNPWGQNSDTTSGTTRIPLAQFQRNFTDMIVELPA